MPTANLIKSRSSLSVLQELHQRRLGFPFLLANGTIRKLDKLLTPLKGMSPKIDLPWTQGRIPWFPTYKRDFCRKIAHGWIMSERNALTEMPLYRPDNVNNLVQRIEDLWATNERWVLMVHEPQAVAKSTSLINLSRYLLASRKYTTTLGSQVFVCARSGKTRDI